MKKAILSYEVYGKIIHSNFNLKSKNIYISDCKLFEFILSYSGKSESYKVFGKLSWIDSKRPPVGLKFIDFRMDLDFEKFSSLKIFQHGYQSWSFSSSHASIEKDSPPLVSFLKYPQENVYTHHSNKTGDFQSEGFLVAHSEKEGKGFFVGVGEIGTQNVKFQVKLDQDGKAIHLSAIWDFYFFPELARNIKISLTPIEYENISGGFPENSIQKYFEKIGKLEVARKFPKEVPTGWCSWYYYYTAITEEIILENLKQIRRKNLDIEFFQIDDGYQREIGDWLVQNEKFPNGLTYLSQKIRRENLIPGIWLAPFLVRKKSEFFQKYPEAILKDKNGKPVPALWQPAWGFDYTYCIDTTHPASENFLETVFKTFVKEYGFPYLKLDFLYSGSLPGVCYTKNLTPLERYRKAIKLIRKIVGKDVFLLGCGAPIVPSIGIFDGMRIGCDVAPFWKPELTRRLLRDRDALSTEKALVNVITRSSMHRNFWLNDPDCLLVRSDKNKMTIDQTILMATVMSLSGGMLLISDNLMTISEDRLDILRKALSLNKKCQSKVPVPLGLFEHSFPRGLYNPAGFFGVWNPTDEAEWVEVKLPFSLKKGKIKNYWSNKPIEDFSYDSVKKTIKVKLYPYGSVVIEKT
ncbi:MAG: alpha-galactosidase [Leptospiraceae bacterium]|nr:alpha-galactosidase [Leptospiraceae bacterium]MCK6381594.1 alpha-galactosidase [Leptospiraceae bacterium]NUM40630.1 alpha-galactosidase [Leptospiraceae bacterium]